MVNLNLIKVSNDFIEFTFRIILNEVDVSLLFNNSQLITKI